MTSFINIPWWINLLIGLGMLAFGELLKIAGGSGQAPGKVAFGQSIQFFSIVFLGFAAICFLISCFRDFFSANVPAAEAAPAPPRAAQPPAPPPSPKKRKYTDRDFMPAALRAELDAKETPASPEPPLKPAPPPPPPARSIVK